jgi:hypothetical protein
MTKMTMPKRNVFKPSFQRFLVREKLKAHHLKFVKFPNESWWPCLAFKDFEEMIGVLEVLPTEFTNAKFQAAACTALCEQYTAVSHHHDHHDRTTTQEEAPPPQPYLKLGEKTTFYETRPEQVAFTSTLGIQKLLELKIRASSSSSSQGNIDEDALKRAVEDATTFMRHLHAQEEEGTTSSNNNNHNNNALHWQSSEPSTAAAARVKPSRTTGAPNDGRAATPNENAITVSHPARGRDDSRNIMTGANTGRAAVNSKEKDLTGSTFSRAAQQHHAADSTSGRAAKNNTSNETKKAPPPPPIQQEGTEQASTTENIYHTNNEDTNMRVEESDDVDFPPAEENDNNGSEMEMMITSSQSTEPAKSNKRTRDESNEPVAAADDDDDSGTTSDTRSTPNSSATDGESQDKTNVSRRNEPRQKTKPRKKAKSSTRKKKEIPEFPITIPSWDEVRPIFEEIGYVFFVDDQRCHHYCRAYGDLRKYTGAKENVDYFTTESSFRSFLCKNGIDYLWVPFDEKQENSELLLMWVRYSIIPSAASGKKIPNVSKKKKTKSNALKILKKAGVKHINTPLGNYPLKIPGIQTLFPDPELWEYFARNGLPATLNFKNVPKEDRLTVELCAASNLVRLDMQ